MGNVQTGALMHYRHRKQPSGIIDLIPDTTPANAGKAAAEARLSEAEAAHERALAFAREESDQALALVCADLAALQSAVAAASEAIASVLTVTGMQPALGCDAAASEAAGPAERKPEGPTGLRRRLSGQERSSAASPEEAACKVKWCSEAAAECIRRVCAEAASLAQERGRLASDLADSSANYQQATQRISVLTQQLAAATSAAHNATQRAQQAERANQQLTESEASLQQELQGLRGNASALEVSQVQLEARLSMLQQAKAALEEACAAKDSANAELVAQLEGLQGTVQRLEAEARESKATREALQGELARSAASLGAETLLRTQAQEELAAARQAGDDLVCQLEAASRASAKVRGHVNALHTSLCHLWRTFPVPRFRDPGQRRMSTCICTHHWQS